MSKTAFFPCRSSFLARQAQDRGIPTEERADVYHDGGRVWMLTVRTKEDLDFITNYFEVRGAHPSALDGCIKRFNSLNEQ